MISLRGLCSLAAHCRPCPANTSTCVIFKLTLVNFTEYVSLTLAPCRRRSSSLCSSKRNEGYQGHQSKIDFEQHFEFDGRKTLLIFSACSKAGFLYKLYEPTFFRLGGKPIHLSCATVTVESYICRWLYFSDRDTLDLLGTVISPKVDPSINESLCSED